MGKQKDHDVVISMSALPSRFRYVKATIDSLVNQTAKLPIYIFIPEKCKRTGEVFSGMIPQAFRQKRIRVEVVKDLGPITKLVYALEKASNVITVDDDVIYHKEMAEGLIHHKQPDNAICYRGRTFGEDHSYNKTGLLRCDRVFELENVDIITGTWGAIYSSEHFKIKELKTKHKLTDDIVISSVLRRKGIKMFVAPGHIATPTKAHKVDDLWRLNLNHVNNNKAIKDLFSR